MNSLRTLVVVIKTCHVSLALALVYNKNNLCCNLSAKECRLIESNIFPFREVLRWLDRLDRRGCLTVRGVCIV